VTEIVRKVSWLPDSPPRLISTIGFHADDSSLFITDLPLAEQCRFAVQQIVGGTDSQSSASPSIKKGGDRSICRIVWISGGGGGDGDEDCLAALALHAVCAKEFQAKSLIFLSAGDSPAPTNDALLLALASSFSLMGFLETPIRIRDVVAIGRSSEHGPMAVYQDEPLPGLGLDSALLGSSFRGWTLGPLVEVENTKPFPLAIFSKGMKIAIDTTRLTTGVIRFYRESLFIFVGLFWDDKFQMVCLDSSQGQGKYPLVSGSSSLSKRLPADSR
jgi:hypothetical protein